MRPGRLGLKRRGRQIGGHRYSFSSYYLFMISLLFLSFFFFSFPTIYYSLVSFLLYGEDIQIKYMGACGRVG